jgi:hypothetical protein
MRSLPFAAYEPTLGEITREAERDMADRLRSFGSTPMGRNLVRVAGEIAQADAIRNGVRKRIRARGR